jgi:hypothetical protein
LDLATNDPGALKNEKSIKPIGNFDNNIDNNQNIQLRPDIRKITLFRSQK